MRKYWLKFWRPMGFLVLVFFMSGCAASLRQPAVIGDPVPLPAAENTGMRWWQLRFVFDWPETAEPAWHLDLLLAHRVIAPILEKHRAAIPLWRFHRRAARDATGHQFSLIFYAGADLSGQVLKAAQAAPDVVGLRASGALKKVSLGPAGAGSGRRVADTSDPVWSVEVKKSWPWFIMGVSRMWLTLADEKAATQAGGSPPGTLPDRITFYRQLNQAVTRVWQEEGAHAFLHHLNAVFGYEPLVFREERLLRF